MGKYDCSVSLHPNSRDSSLSLRERGVSRFCCLNSQCPDYGRRDAGNLTVTGRLGKSRQFRLLSCRSCRDRFSERKGTPLYRAHLPEDKVTSILDHIREGCGVLKTARLVKVHPDTVSRYGRAAGEHARAAPDELVARSPETRELQMDEKWSFVAKKEASCDEDDPEDRFRGDCWDHVAFDPEHRLVVSVVPGERTSESVRELVTDVKGRLDGRTPDLITTDEDSAYEGAILEAFGTEVVPPRTGKPGRPRKPYKVAPAGLHYATVHKTRRKGRVVAVATRVIFGTVAAVEAVLANSGVSRTVNTAFVERHNGTDRNRNAPKVRRTYCFSKDWWIHRAVTFFTMYSYNFCWPVRRLKTKAGEGRTPAMMARLADHVWTLAEWLSRPAVQLA
jgi:IS1 family transposase/transposase-like protein